MYEEEDDDLPLQYRRLTAHLQTNSSDFNRRLSAYLTSHQAMRNALSQALSNSYAQSAGQAQGNGMPQQGQMQKQQPWMAQQNQPFDLTMPGDPAASPSADRQATANWGMTPYPSVSGQSPTATHQRNASIATPTATSFAVKQEKYGGRRQSEPAPLEQSALSAHMAKMAAPGFNGAKQTSINTLFPQPAGTPVWDDSNNDLGPFATDLPNEARMFLEHQSVSSQFTAPGALSKTGPHLSYNGMDQTLAPGAVDTKLDDIYTWDTLDSATSTDAFAPKDMFNSSDYDTFAAGHTSQPATPGEDMWAFIDNAAYEESTT